METLHYWTEPHPKLSLCVSPSDPGGRWMSFIRKLPVSQRENVRAMGYWKLDESLYDEVSAWCIRSTWMMLPGRPPGSRRSRGERRSRGAEEQVEANLPFDKLFLLPSAPKIVATAVFNLLAQDYHPDRNEGSVNKEEMARKMSELTNAKAEIWKGKGW